MADYTTRYTFEIDLIEQDVVRKAQQLSHKLEAALARDASATSKLAGQQRELRAAYDATNAAITSQTRRLSYHMHRLEEVEARVRSLATAEQTLYTGMSAAGERVFDSLVESARRAFDEIVGHSILRDMLREAKAIYDRLQTLGYGSFDAAIADAARFLEVMRLIRAEMAGMSSGPPLITAGGGGGGGGGGLPPALPPSLTPELPVPWTPKQSAAFQDFVDTFDRSKYTMEDWFNTFNAGLNRATLQWFGLRRLGYGFESIGRTMTRTGATIFETLTTLGEGYIGFNEAATRAAMAMEMQAEMQDVLEEKILETAQALGLFAPEELAEGLRLWAAGTGEVIRTETALNEILERTVDLQKLAAMNREDLGAVTQATGGIMHEFGMEMEDVTHIAEVLNFVAAKTFAEVSDVGKALEYVGPIANQLGVSFEEVAATVGVLADVNIVASRSGRALRQMFVQMLKPTKDHNDALNAALGLSGALGQSWQEIVFPGGEFIGLAKYIDLIAAATEEWTEQQRASLLATMATANELPVITALVEKQIEARAEGRNIIEEETAALSEAHTLMGQMWQRYEESDAARVGRMRARWDAAMKEMGKAVIEAGVPLAETAVDLLLKIADIVDKAPWLATAAIGAAGINIAAGSLLTIVGKLFGIMANMMIMKGAFAAFGTSTGIFSAAVKQFAIAAGVKAQPTIGVAPAAAGGVAPAVVASVGLGVAGLGMIAAGFAGREIASKQREVLEEQLDVLQLEEEVQRKFLEMFARVPGGGFRPTTQEGRILAEVLIGPVSPRDIVPENLLDEILDRIRSTLAVTTTEIAARETARKLREGVDGVGGPPAELYPPGMGAAPELAAQKEINDQLVALQEEFEQRIAAVRSNAAEKRAAEQSSWEEWQRDALEEHLKRSTDIETKYNNERVKLTEAFQLQQLQKEAEFALSESRKLEDYNLAVAEAERDHQQGMLADSEAYAAKLADLLDDYNERKEDAAEKHQLEMQRMERDHQSALLQLADEHQQKLLELAEDNSERLADLAERFQEAELAARTRLEEHLADLATRYQEEALEAAVQRAERIADLNEQLRETELEDAERHAERLADLLEQLHDDEAAAAEEHAKRVGELDEDYQEGIEDDAKEHADRLSDITEDFEKAEQDDAEKHAERISDITEDYHESIEDDAEKHAKRVLDIEEDYQKATERAAEDHLLRMSRMEQDHFDRLADLIRERDARGLILEMRDYTRRVEEEEEDYDVARTRRQEDHQDRLAEEAANFAELKKRRQDDYEERLQEEQENYERRRQQRRDNYKDDLKEEEERYEEQKRKRWEQWQERLQEELERYEEWKAKRQEDYADQIAEEEERFQEEKERRQREHQEALQELEEEFASAAEERKKQYEKRRQELRAEYARDAKERAAEYEKQRQEEATRYAEQVADEKARYADQKERREKAYEEKRQDALDDYTLASEDRKEAYEKQVEEEAEQYEAQREKRIAQYEAERKEVQDEYDFRAARRAEDYERARRQDAEAFARKQAEAERQFREAVAAEEARYNEAYSERERHFNEQLIQIQNELAEEERLLEDAHREKMRNLAGYFGEIEASYAEHYDRLLRDAEIFLNNYQHIWDQLQGLGDAVPRLPVIPKGMQQSMALPGHWLIEPDGGSRAPIDGGSKQEPSYGPYYPVTPLPPSGSGEHEPKYGPYIPPRGLDNIIDAISRDADRRKVMGQNLQSRGGTQISIHMSLDNTWNLPPGTSKDTAETVRDVAYDAAYAAISDAMEKAEARLGS